MPDSRKNKKGPIEKIKSPRSHRLKLERIKPTYKQAEEVTQRSRKEWEKTFNAISDWVVLMDVGGRILRTNSIGEDFTGVPLDEMIGQSCCSLVHGSEKKMPGCPLLKMLETGQRATVELQVPGADCWVMVTVDPVTDEEGKIKGAIHITRDVTKRRETEEALKESEEHARIFASYQHAISELREFYVREANLEQMLQKTVDLIVRNFGYYMAWFGELKADEKVIIPKVWAGKYEKYLEGLQLELNDSKDAKCAVSIAIVKRKPFGYADLEHDKDFEKWRPLAVKYGYRSNQAVPLVINDKSIGAFLVYSTRRRAFSETLIQYLTGIVNELATIVDNITKQKNAEEELRKYHEHLEEMIEERTVELKTVNERLKGDITERKRVEDALRESEEKYRSLVDNSPDFIYLVDREEKIQFINRTQPQHTKEDVVGRSIYEFLPSEYHDLARKKIKDVFQSGRVQVFEIKAIGPGNAFTFYETRCVPISSEGKIVSFLGIATDITDRKKAEDALKESESRYRNIFNSACDGLCIVDGNGTILEANPQMCKMYGYSYQELIGTDAEKLVQPDHIHLFKKFKEEVQKRGRFQAESVNTRKDGTLINIEVTGTTFNFKGQKCKLAILRDVTERKKVEKKLQEYQEKLRSLASELSLTEERERRWMATELHDRIVQPLVFVKMKIDELGPLTTSVNFCKPLEELSDMLDEVVQETQTLTCDLGSPTLYELGLEAALKEWLTEEIGQKHNIATFFEDDGAPKPLGEEISAFLFRSVRELLVNVVKHAQAHKIKVSLKREGDKIIICVADDGIGFKFSDTSIPKDKKGGYGLFSIKEYLNYIGGCLDIKSEPGFGTQAFLIAPLKENDVTTGV